MTTTRLFAPWRLHRYNDAMHVRDIGAQTAFDWNPARIQENATTGG